jgi:FKBP-type peptidyl-prolyl cis-trans isomerase
VAAEPNKKTPDNDRAKMMRTLIPAGAIALVVILVAVIASLSGGERKMSDGSNGSADDPDLKEIATGVKVRDLKEGTGEPCQQGAKVKINYTGWLTDGIVFDSNKDKPPVEFELSGLIQGWQIGIPGMKPGGKRKLVIAPDKGYGNQAKGKIPPGSTLIFEVELISASGGTRPRRTPSPTNLAKLVDGTAPNADDPNLMPIGDRGLKYRDIKVGDGDVVVAGAHVVMDYTGWRLPDGKMFDSSWKPGGRPLDIALSGLIKGWQEGVPGMKVGGIRKLVIPPALGYPSGAGEDIPPGTTLVFEVELLGIK